MSTTEAVAPHPTRPSSPSTTPARRAWRPALAACALTTVVLGVGASAAAAADTTTHRVDVYDARIAGEAWANATAQQGPIKRVKQLRIAFDAEARGLTFRDGQAQGEVPAVNQTQHQPRYSEVITDPTWIDGSCSARRWSTPTGGRLVVSTLIGEHGGYEARFGAADFLDGPRTCVGRMPGEFESTDNGLRPYAKFELPRGEIGQRVIRIPVTGDAGGCPFTHGDTACDSRLEGEVVLTLRQQYVEEDAAQGGSAPTKPPAAPPGTPPKGVPATKPGGGSGILSGLRAKAGRKDGSVTARCSTACTGTYSAYAVALSKQGKPKGTAKRIGGGRLRRVGGGARQRAATGAMTVGARVRFDRRARRLVRQRRHVQYRLDVRPTAGGAAVRENVTAAVRRR